MADRIKEIGHLTNPDDESLQDGYAPDRRLDGADLHRPALPIFGYGDRIQFKPVLLRRHGAAHVDVPGRRVRDPVPDRV